MGLDSLWLCERPNLEGRLKSYWISEKSAWAVLIWLRSNGKPEQDRRTNFYSVQVISWFSRHLKTLWQQSKLRRPFQPRWQQWLLSWLFKWKLCQYQLFPQPILTRKQERLRGSGQNLMPGNSINIIGQADIINSVADVKYLVRWKEIDNGPELCKSS